MLEIKNPALLNVTKAVNAWVDSWPNQNSYTDFLRASSLHGVCPREFVFNYWQPKANRSFDAKSRVLMSIGTHLHSLKQNQVLGPLGILWGTWKYVGSSEALKTHEGFHPDPDEAVWAMVHEKEQKWEYVEPEVWDEKYRIKGHIDGLIDVGRLEWLNSNLPLLKKDPISTCKRLHAMAPTQRMLFELKTTGSFVFDKLVAPKDIADYYQMQACIYQRLMGVSHTLFWYVNRDTAASKLLLYAYDAGWWRDATRKARIIWESIRDEVLPEALMPCHSPTDKRAKECVHCPVCFGKLDFKKYVESGKERAAKEGRKLLDLRGISFETPA
jgi:hypothetical protein